MSGWTMKTIGDLCLRVTSGGTPNRSRPELYSPAAFPWVKTGDLNDAYITKYSEYISNDGVSESSAKLLPAETVLMAMYGATVGKLGILHEPATCNQAACAMVTNPDVCTPRWLFYALLNDRDRMVTLANGAAQQNLSGTTIRKFELLTPPFAEQEAIAEVLGSLDDKIAANTKLLTTIDTHMALEFTSSVDNEDRWTELDKVAVFHNRRRVPLSSREREERTGTVPYYGASGPFGTVDVPIFDENLVLVGEDGSVINADGTPVVQYIWGPAWVNNHAHVLTGRMISTELLYLAISREQVATLVTGAVQPKINMGNLKRLQLRLPSPSSLPRLEALVSSETAMKRSAIEENRSLAATRDALLPQLMSGKFRVKDAEALVSAAI